MSKGEFEKRLDSLFARLEKFNGYLINCRETEVRMQDLADEMRKEFLELAPEFADPEVMRLYEPLVAKGIANGYVKLLVALAKWFGTV